MRNFNNFDDDFDKEFAKTAKFTRRFIVAIAIVMLLLCAGAIWAGYTIVMHFWG